MTARRQSRRQSTRRGSAQFLMFKDLECKEEFQKVRLAGFLRELHQLATEDQKAKVRDSVLNVVKTRSNNSGGNNKYLSLPEDLASLTSAQAQEAIEALLRYGKKLDSASLMRLIQAGVAVLKEEETVVDLRDVTDGNALKQVTVVGDLHGSLNCLKKVMELVQYEALEENRDRVIVFDGDYVDRGDHSLEVLASLLLLKLSHTQQVFLLRGNHEDTMTASTYGFRDELEDKYADDDNADAADEIWYELGHLFAALPICARSHTAAIMHGGIPMENLELSTVNELSKDIRCELKTIADPYDDDERLIQGILWSDPSEEPGINYSERGAGFTFGPDITKDFLERHDLKYVIRAHEPFEDGMHYMNIDNMQAEEPVTDGTGRGVITVFSTANYPNGEGTNAAAILHLNDETGAYEAVTFIHKDAMDQSAASLNSLTTSTHEAFLASILDDHKRKVIKAFKAAQDTATGTVTCEQWADILAEQLELPVRDQLS